MSGNVTQKAVGAHSPVYGLIVRLVSIQAPSCVWISQQQQQQQQQQMLRQILDVYMVRYACSKRDTQIRSLWY